MVGRSVLSRRSVQREGRPAELARERLLRVGRYRRRALGAREHADRLADLLLELRDLLRVLARGHVDLEVAEVPPRARDESHGVVDGSLLVVHVDDLLRADGLAPLLVDPVAPAPAGTPEKPRIEALRDVLPRGDRVDVAGLVVAEVVLDLPFGSRRVHGGVAEDDEERSIGLRRRHVGASPLREQPVALGLVAAASLAVDPLEIVLEVEALGEARRLERPAIARAVADRGERDLEVGAGPA